MLVSDLCFSSWWTCMTCSTSWMKAFPAHKQEFIAPIKVVRGKKKKSVSAIRTKFTFIKLLEKKKMSRTFWCLLPNDNLWVLKSQRTLCCGEKRWKETILFWEPQGCILVSCDQLFTHMNIKHLFISKSLKKTKTTRYYLM